MAERLWNLLMRFHREVVAPDVQQTLIRFHREVVKPDIEASLAHYHQETMIPTLIRFHREVVKPDIEASLARYHQETMVPTLIRFHREVLAPDVERIFDDRVDKRVGALRDEMVESFDGVYKRFDRLEDEYQSLSAAVRRIEEQHQSEN